MIPAVPARPAIATRLLPKRAPMEPLKRRLTPYATRNVVSRNPRSWVGKCNRRWNSALTATYASRDAWNDAHAMYVTMTIRYLRTPGGGGDAASETDMARAAKTPPRRNPRGCRPVKTARRGAPSAVHRPESRPRRTRESRRRHRAVDRRRARRTGVRVAGCDNTHDRDSTPLRIDWVAQFRETRLGFGPCRVHRSNRSNRAVPTTVSFDPPARIRTSVSCAWRSRP